MSRALTAIPPRPRRCKDLRPAFSTRKSWRTDRERDRGQSDAPPLLHKGTQRDAGSNAHRNDGEDGVDDAGSDGGVDGLLHAGAVEDPGGVVEDLREEDEDEEEETHHINNNNNMSPPGKHWTTQSCQEFNQSLCLFSLNAFLVIFFFFFFFWKIQLQESELKPQRRIKWLQFWRPVTFLDSFMLFSSCLAAMFPTYLTYCGSSVGPWTEPQKHRDAAFGNYATKTWSMLLLQIWQEGQWKQLEPRLLS